MRGRINLICAALRNQRGFKLEKMAELNDDKYTEANSSLIERCGKMKLEVEGQDVSKIWCKGLKNN